MLEPRQTPTKAALKDVGIVYFGNDWHAENRTSSHHVATRLAKSMPLLYVDSPGMRAPSASGRDFKRAFRKIIAALKPPVKVAENFWHCTVPQLPFRRVPGVEAFNRLFSRWAVRRALRHAGITRRISWFVVPHPGFMAKHLGEELCVFYCIDDYAAHPGVDTAMIAQRDEALSRCADLLFVAPPALLETKRALNPSTVFAPHGVDVELFRRACDPQTEVPAAARGLPAPVIGYIGSVHEWIDLELIAWLARERPQWSFLLVGHAAADVSALRALPNVHLVGAQPYASLPAWAKAFDAAIIPYRLNRQVANANPLKLREYLATGKPVVSVRNAEIEKFSRWVRIADDHAGFLAALDIAIQDQSAEATAARIAAVADQTWDRRVEDVLDTVAQAMALRQQNPSSLFRLPMATDSLPTLRVAVVGAGYVATHHLAALKALDFVEIVGICDTQLSAAQALAQRFNVPLAAASLAELASARPQAVHVLTPPSSHAAIALAAMEMGCHVLVEKPMADSVADCEAMIARAREKRLTLGVNHSDLFDPVLLKALDAVRNDRIGDVLSVDIIRNSEYPAYAGGPLPGSVTQGSYPFRDLGVHGLYTIEAFLGQVKQLDVAYQARGGDPNLHFDEWQAHAHTERGVGRLLLSWNARPMENRLFVRGTRGTIEVDRFLQTCRIHRVLPGPKFIGIVMNSFFSAVKDVFRIPWNVVRFATGMLQPSPGIRRGAQEFAQAVRHQMPPPFGGEDALRIAKLLEPACAEPDRLRLQSLEDRYVPLEPADALVTGAGGFLGRRLVARLRKRGQRVRVLVRRPVAEYANDSGVQMVVGDLGDPRIVAHAVAGASVVYHVGAAMRGSVRDFEAGTVWGTRNVIDACVKSQPRRLVYVSSMSVFDHAGRDPQSTMVEASPFEPHPELRGAYTQTKLSAERDVHAAIRNHGVPAVILRPGQIFGPGAERVTPNGVIALAGRWVAIGSGAMTLPLIYIEDVIDALLQAAEAPDAVGRVFNVVDPHPVTQQAYLERCRRKLGDELKIVRTPAWMFMTLGFGVELLGKLLRRDVPLTRYRVRSLRPLANFDVSAARDGLGWTPRIGVEKGLDATFG